MEVKFTKKHKSAKEPIYSHGTDAAMDLSCVSVDYGSSEYIEYDTGLAFEIPDGFFGLVCPRSSITKKGLMLGNSVGVIDAGYRGSIKFRFKKVSNGEVYNVGDRIGQLIIMPRPSIKLVEVDALNETERNEGGYGSTGK